MAYELYRRGYKVLLLDNDKQGNLSKAYGRYDAESVAPITKTAFRGMAGGSRADTADRLRGIDIVSANMSLMGATWQLTTEETGNQIERYKRLAQLDAVGAYYDFCIIDNPPDIGLNVVNALTVTDEVIVPVKIDEWALEGLDILADQIEDARQFNPALRLLGVLVTAYQNTDGEAAGREWLETEKESYSLLGVIRYSGKVAESTFLFKPIYEYSPCCGAAQDYKKFVTRYTGKAR